MSSLLGHNLVATSDDLAKALQLSKVEIPRRGEGRTSDHTEPWLLAHLLSSLNAAEELLFPLRWLKSERPDYLLSWDRRDYGVELSEIVSPAWAHAAAVVGREFPGTPISPSSFKWGSKVLSREELIDHVSSGSLGPGWGGDQMEKEWADALADTVQKKLKKLQGYSVFDENWLVLYDNHSVPLLEEEDAVRLARNRLGILLSSDALSFDKVFVMMQNRFVELSRRSFRFFKVVDPW